MQDARPMPQDARPRTETFTTHKLQITVVGVGGSRPMTHAPCPKTHAPRLRTHAPGGKTQDARPKIETLTTHQLQIPMVVVVMRRGGGRPRTLDHGPGPKTQDPGPKMQDTGPRAQNRGCWTQDASLTLHASQSKEAEMAQGDTAAFYGMH